MALCIFGDSIVYGRGARLAESWATLLRTHLEAKNPQYRVYALGIPGQRTDQLLERFVPEARAREAQAVLFAIGINDAKHTQRITPDIFEQNLRKLHQQAVALVPRVAFLGLTRINDAAMTAPVGEPRHTNAAIQVYDKIIEKVCGSLNTPYLPLAHTLEISDLADGLHPNATGYQKMFQKILPFVENWLQ